MRALECPRCGAPLDGPDQGGYVACRYCGTRVVARSEPRPVPHVPRPHWPAPSAHKPGRGATVLVAVVVGVCLLGAIGVWAASASGDGPWSTSGGRDRDAVAVADVIAISPAEPKTTVVARFGKPLRDGKYLDLKLKDSPFESVLLIWETDEHLTSAHFRPAGKAMPPAVIESLRKQLGRSFAGESGELQFSGPGVTLSCSSTLYFNVHERSDPRWKARVVALWTAVTHAALAAPKSLDLTTRRDLLNVDYELAELAKLDPETRLEQSQAAVRKLFPGAVTNGASQSVGVSHPWFAHADLAWENQRGGKFLRLNLYYPTRPTKPNHQPDVRRCLEPLLGAPQIQEMDHVAKKHNLDWRERAGWPRAHASEQLLMLFYEGSGRSKTRPSEWRRVLARLSECARAPG